MRVLIAAGQAPFKSFGLGPVAEQLARVVRQLGHDTDVVELPFEPGCDRLTDHLLALRCLDVTDSGGSPVDRLVAVGFPAYVLRHPAKAVWLTAYSAQGCAAWADTDPDSMYTPGGAAARRRMDQADQVFLAECTRVVAASRALADRARRLLGVSAQVAYLPVRSTADDQPIERGDYFVAPLDRVSEARQRLLADVMARVTGTFALRLISESTHTSSHFPTPLGGRMQVCQPRDEVELDRLVRGARGLVYVPEAVDHWPRSFLVALQAHVPVMTASDSGAACELLRDGQNGLIVEPMAPAVADAMTSIARDAARAGRLGAAGHRSLVEHDITWERAARALVG